MEKSENIWEMPFVIYLDKKGEPFFQPMIVDESVGKANDVRSFLMKTHERASLGERYVCRDNLEYIRKLLNLGAIVYEGYNLLHISNVVERGNIEMLMQLLSQTLREITIFKYQSIEQFEQVKTGDMDGPALKKVLMSMVYE